MRPTKLPLAAGLLSVATLTLLNTPTATATTATPPDGSLTFYAEPDFTAPVAVYPDGPADACTALPAIAHGHLNLSQRAVTVHETTDCSGQGLTFPANDIHSFRATD